MPAARKLTTHQADIMRQVARRLAPRPNWAAAATRTAVGKAFDSDGVMHYVLTVGSAGALAHLADKGYLAAIGNPGSTMRTQAYVLTTQGREWWEARQAPTTMAMGIA